jgi:hypothetical protein
MSDKDTSSICSVCGNDKLCDIVEVEKGTVKTYLSECENCVGKKVCDRCNHVFENKVPK